MDSTVAGAAMIALLFGYVLNVVATAYCLTGTTATGTTTEYGVAAVDPRVIPLHSRFFLHGKVFRAEDTGALIRGHRVDIYMSNCTEATRYGARRLKIRIISKK